MPNLSFGQRFAAPCWVPVLQLGSAPKDLRPVYFAHYTSITHWKAWIVRSNTPAEPNLKYRFNSQSDTKGLSFCFFIFCRVTKFLSRWQKIGRDDNWNWRDQFFVIVTKIWSRWQLELSRDQFFVIVTKIWSRWQLELSSWPKIGWDDNWNCHRDQNLVTMTKNWFHWFRSGVIPSVSTCLRAFDPWEV